LGHGVLVVINCSVNLLEDLAYWVCMFIAT